MSIRIVEQSVQREKYSSQFGSTQTLYNELKEAKAQYKKHCKLARIAYAKDRAKINLLQLDKHTTAVERWLNQATAFYQELLKDSALIVQYGVSQEELQQMQAMRGTTSQA